MQHAGPLENAPLGWPIAGLEKLFQVAGSLHEICTMAPVSAANTTQRPVLWQAHARKEFHRPLTTEANEPGLQQQRPCRASGLWQPNVGWVSSVEGKR